jgi:hypothetical protein
VFAPECDFIDCLVNHVEQKSISELLNKFMGIMDHEFSDDSSAGKEIGVKQR